MPSASQPSLARLALFLALFATILGAKLLLIERYGSDLPYWDQWDAEADLLYRPYLEGKLDSTLFFRAHNEHRPVLTRVLALALFEFNERQWDGRIQMIVNAALHASVALLLLALAARALPFAALVGFATCTALFFGMNVSWENTLSGFQSQFYFFLLFSGLHLGGTLLAPARSRAWWFAPLAGLATLFNVASGLLSALAILAVTALRIVRARTFSRDDAFVLGANIALVVAGWLLKAAVPGHTVLQAAGFAGWLDAWLHQLAWPVVAVGTAWLAPLGLIAPLALLAAWWRRRVEGSLPLTLLAANVWVVLQTMAIAYARGGTDHGYSSRYTDNLALGVLINLLTLAYLAAASSPGSRSRRAALGATAVFAGISLWGLSRESAATRDGILRGLPAVNAARTANVRAYLATRDPAFFGKAPWDELPYPSATRLAQLLDDPLIRETLPASVRPPLRLTFDPSTPARLDAYVPNPAVDAPPEGRSAWQLSTPGSAGVRSETFLLNRTRFTLFVVTGGQVADVSFALIDDAGHAHPPLGAAVSTTSPHRWKRLNFSVPAGRYRLEAAKTGTGWLAFTQPITDTPLSRFARRFAGGGPWWLTVGVTAGLVACALARPRAPPTPSGPDSRRDALSAAVAGVLACAVVALLLVRLGVLPDPVATNSTQRRAPPAVSAVTGFTLVSPDGPKTDFEGGAYLMGGADATWLGTHLAGVGDAFTGRVVSSPFKLHAPLLHVPIAGYPGRPGNALVLEVLDPAGAVTATVPYRGPEPRETEASWDVPIPAGWRGLSARLVLTDGLTASEGWLAVRAPSLDAIAGAAWLRGVPRNYGWFTVTALALAALLFLPGLAWRTWAPASFPVGAAYLAVPGLLVLALGGLAIWLGGPGATALPFNVWLAGLALAALALVRRWWRDGGPLSADEGQALGAYAAVVVSALAFGVLPLEVAQEMGARSTAQSRMIASPPDHEIPWRTGAFFLHGKAARGNTDAYFGRDWSAASRGPLAPLADTAAFVLAGAGPADPPQYARDRWSAASDGFHLTRIVGVLTNALVVLGGALLATRLAGAASARVALVWLAGAPVVIINTDFLWPKLLATFFVLLAVTAAVERRPTWQISGWTALAYLSHPVGGLFAPPLALFLAHRGWRAARADGARFAALAPAALFSLGLLAYLAPWFAFKAWIGRPDVFLHYPLGDGRGFLHAADSASWLSCRLDNLRFTLLPGAFHFSDQMKHWLGGPLSEPLRWAIGYAKTLPGSLGFGLFFVAVAALVRRPAEWAVAFRLQLLAGAFVLMLVFWGYSTDGLGRNCLEPLAVLLIVYASCVLSPTWAGWRWLLLLTALEALGVRAIGVLFAPNFDAAQIAPETVALAAVAVLAALAPAAAYFARPARAPAA